MTWNKSAFIHIVLFLAVVIFGEAPSYFLLLTVAQVVYILLTLQMIAKKGEWFTTYYPFFAFPAYYNPLASTLSNK